MTARRQLVYLYERPSYSEVRVVETNLDHKDDAMLREVLEAQVMAYKGTLRLDLSRYWIQVRDLGPSTIRVYRAEVDASGRTRVKR